MGLAIRGGAAPAGDYPFRAGLGWDRGAANPFRLPESSEIDCTLGDFEGFADFDRWIEWSLRTPLLRPSQVVEDATAGLAAYDKPFLTLFGAPDPSARIRGGAQWAPSISCPARRGPITILLDGCMPPLFPTLSPAPGNIEIFGSIEAAVSSCDPENIFAGVCRGLSFVFGSETFARMDECEIASCEDLRGCLLEANCTFPFDQRGALPGSITDRHSTFMKIRAIDPWVNVNMGETRPEEYLIRVKEDYFKAGEEFFQSIEAERLVADMDAAGIEKAVLSIGTQQPDPTGASVPREVPRPVCVRGVAAAHGQDG